MPALCVYAPSLEYYAASISGIRNTDNVANPRILERPSKPGPIILLPSIKTDSRVRELAAQTTVWFVLGVFHL